MVDSWFMRNHRKPRSARVARARRVAPHFVICTVPLTFTVTVPLPGSTGNASSDATDTDLACIMIGRCTGGCSLLDTLTSRIEYPE